ncbi:hypothetical protein SAMN05660420_03386 [Desulfuromusa kysingii]|uniref:Uncharacterized protein n=1 Tax=Desulfuromusa kysingii TaxID=37625 RepID=A0A1H4EIC2_9BACT|nr:hypothetical protein [Desulfuromusa kysingii]SEA84448.1 hypothetical protein SAMN05660420_03386 [Desulfuromusa kysingii]
MAFQFKKISSHGTENPIIARLSVQANDLVNFCNFSKEKKEELFAIFHSGVQPKLITCYEVFISISKECRNIEDTVNTEGLNIQSQDRVIEVPHLEGLESKIDQFLYSAKSCLRELAKIFGLFFGKEFSEARYDQVKEWATKEFGEASELAKIISQDHDLWIKKLVSMRNAVEHPGGYSGHLHIHNYDLLPENHPDFPKLIEPTWHLNEEPRVSIRKDLEVSISNILHFSEDMLVLCMRQSGLPEIIQIVEIPEAERDEKCPVRLKFTLSDKINLTLIRPPAVKSKDNH